LGLRKKIEEIVEILRSNDGQKKKPPDFSWKNPAACMVVSSWSSQCGRISPGTNNKPPPQPKSTCRQSHFFNLACGQGTKEVHRCKGDVRKRHGHGFGVCMLIREG
jgi:hypothetical protein